MMLEVGTVGEPQPAGSPQSHCSLCPPNTSALSPAAERFTINMRYCTGRPSGSSYCVSVEDNRLLLPNVVLHQLINLSGLNGREYGEPSRSDDAAIEFPRFVSS